MSIPRMTASTDNIQALADRPNDQNGMSAAELKAAFDKAGDDIKSYINNTLIPYLEGTDAANGIGIDTISSLTAENVQDALAELAEQIADLREEIHSSETAPVFSVTGGQYRYQESPAAGGVNWELALLSGTNATIRFTKMPTNIDVFLVGGGSNGGLGHIDSRYEYGGDGGLGGGVVMNSNVHIEANTDYSFTVGRSGQPSTIFGETTYGAPYGYRYETGRIASTSDGARSEIGFTDVIAALPGISGALAFGEQTSLLFSGRRYSACGGGGGLLPQERSTAVNGAAGGVTGGGAGGSQNAEAANGEDNTGSGGGGAFWSNGHSGAPGVGGSGIIIIRNARG